MKKLIAVICMLTVLCGCTPEKKEEYEHGDYPYYIMVDGSLYEWTGGESHRESYAATGWIQSYVDPEETPQIDDQSNFGTGYGYSRISKDRIDVYVNGHWRVCKKVEDNK